MRSSRCSSLRSSLSRSQCLCSGRCVEGDGRMLTPRIHPNDRFCLWLLLPVWLLHLAGYFLRTRIRSSSGACWSMRRFFYSLLSSPNADWGGDDFTHVSRDDAGIYLSEGDQGHPGTWIWIGVEDVARLYQEYAERGATILHAPTN